VHETLGTLLSEHLRHMSLEETRANRILWAHLDDDELRAVLRRIAASIEPASLATWIELVRDSGNASERDELFPLLRTAAPAQRTGASS
jgi:hypothetical protein